MKQKKLTRLAVGLLSGIMMIGILTGCLQKNPTTEDPYYNKKYSDTMKTICGEDFSPAKDERCFYIRSMGAGAIFTDLLIEKKTATCELEVSLVKEHGIVFGYDAGIKKNVSTEDKEGLSDVMSFCTKLEDAPYEHQFLLAGIWRNDSKAKESDFEEFKKHFKHLEKCLSADGYDFYYAWNDEFDTSKMQEPEKADFDEVVKDLIGLKSKLCFFQPELTQDENTRFEGDFSSFTTKDTKGNTVTQDIFKNYDLTMVNIWSTWCTACIDEMEELERLRTMLPENVNLISICADGSSENELMEQILSKKGCKFQTLVDGNSLNGAVLDYVSMYPTTVFVDKNGNVVGQPQIGVPGSKEDLGNLSEMMGGDVQIKPVVDPNGDPVDSSSELPEGDEVFEMPNEGEDTSASDGDGFVISGDDEFVDEPGLEDDGQVIGSCDTSIKNTDNDKSIAERYLDLIKQYLEMLKLMN